MLEIEPLIRQRLQDIPGLIGGVHGIADLSQDIQTAAGKRLPAIFVGCDGYRVVDDSTHGAVRVAVRWLVIVAVRQVSDVVGGTDARAAVSDIATEVMSRLYRWQPTPQHQPMMPIQPPPPEYASGLLLLPMAFECNKIIICNG